ncbi:MAG: PHP domain-containing protein [Neisseriaceae bacterium]|nr:PHP domain-containing protein [Neisseriaceae bacterium]
MNIDLHCHSNISDGKLPPDQLVQAALNNGAELLALTDHDHLGGLSLAQKTAHRLGLAFINGVEISVSWRSRNIHIVGLNFTPTDELEKTLHINRQGRFSRLEKIAERLEKKLSVKNIVQGALSFANSPDSVSRTHIAQYLVQQCVVENAQQAFKKYLGDGKIGDIKHQWISLEQAVLAIINASGVAVIAHPARYKISATAMRNLIEEFKTYGGQAIEIATPVHSLNERLNLTLLANRYDLYASAGSDFHGNGEFGRIIGQTPDLPVTCRPVWDLFE